jgi:transcriptional regulator with XRE-family HTH domain
MMARRREKALGPYTEFGARLMAIRRREGLSQEAFGKMVGMTGRGIGLIESGDRKPSVELLAALHERFGVYPDEVVFGRLPEDYHTIRDAADGGELYGSFDRGRRRAADEVAYGLAEGWLSEEDVLAFASASRLAWERRRVDAQIEKAAERAQDAGATTYSKIEFEHVSPSIVRHQLGTFMRRWREKLGVDQKEMAGQLGLRQAALSLVEAGKQRVTIEMLLRIWERWKVTPNEIVLGAFGIDPGAPPTRSPGRHGA